MLLLATLGAVRAQTAAPADGDAGPRVLALVGELEADNVIEVQFANLAQWAEKNPADKLVPYINGRAILGNYPEGIDTRGHRLLFHLEISNLNRAVWVDLLGSPTALRKHVQFSVGLENQSPFPTNLEHQNSPILTVISPVYGIVCLGVIFAMLLIFLFLARRTSLLRDSGPPLVPGRLRPYNLGRVQMAFWFFLTYVSYVVIWIITDDLDTITPALLGLMGISAGTALSEVVIDSGKDSAAAAKLRDLTAEKLALEQNIATLQGQLAELPPGTPADNAFAQNNLNGQLLEKQTRLHQVAQEITAATPLNAGNASVGFLRDILADGNGYSFHRFQIFAWTIVLGIIFVSSVYNNLTMPAFSATLLGLMGMSSGTYIGFKIPEAR